MGEILDEGVEDVDGPASPRSTRDLDFSAAAAAAAVEDLTDGESPTSVDFRLREPEKKTF